MLPCSLIYIRTAKQALQVYSENVVTAAEWPFRDKILFLLRSVIPMFQLSIVRFREQLRESAIFRLIRGMYWWRTCAS